jgi:hypothetical protein
VEGTGEVGWKIGSGIRARWLRIGVPDSTFDHNAYYWDQIQWATARGGEYSNGYYPEADGWILSFREDCCNYGHWNRWFNDECAFGPFTPPKPFQVKGPVATQAQCWSPITGETEGVDIYYAWADENALLAPGPIEDYHGQPYTYSSPAPAAPSRQDAENAIEDELAKPENDLLRRWINHMLGSPGEDDPLKATMPSCDSVSTETCRERIETAGFEHVSTVVETEPDYTRDPDEVLRTEPESGENVDRGTQVVIHTNPEPAEDTDVSDRDREDCEISPHITYPAGNAFDVVDTLYSWDAGNVTLYRGNLWWGRNHIAFDHGWGAPERANTSAALLATEWAPAGVAPAANPRQEGTRDKWYYYYSWTAANGHTHCTTVVVVDRGIDPNEPELDPKQVITSFAYVGWYQLYG